MLVPDAIDRQLARIHEVYVQEGTLSVEDYMALVKPLHEALLVLARGSACTTEDATQTGRGGEQPVETG